MLKTYKNFIGGRWQKSETCFSVTDKFTGESIGRVCLASESDVEAALVSAQQGFLTISRMPAHKRSSILARAGEILEKRKKEIALIISREAGKPIKFARMEVTRGIDTLSLSTEEARRIGGEVIPMDATASGEGLLGFARRKPIGIVAAITPFNFPLNLVLHKVAPALAAGNAVILKPAELTPLTAEALCRIFIDAGLPEHALNLLQGTGETLGRALVTHPKVDAVSFTGSREVGKEVLKAAGIKRVILELGNNSPVVVASDADVDDAARKCALGANYYSGQVCISTQRIYVQKEISDAFISQLVKEVQKLVVGGPHDEKTDIGPLIQESAAIRVESWIKDAVASGARLLTGGKRKGSLITPALLTDTKPTMNLVCNEVFGPVAVVEVCDTFETALEQADASEYGLHASVFTKDIEKALSAIDGLGFGGVVINDTPHLRPDHIPYGGNRQSGLGREGPKYVIEELTQVQTIMIRRTVN